jgi:hypothetical protein
MHQSFEPFWCARDCASDCFSARLRSSVSFWCAKCMLDTVLLTKSSEWAQCTLVFMPTRLLVGFYFFVCVLYLLRLQACIGDVYASKLRLQGSWQFCRTDDLQAHAFTCFISMYVKFIEHRLCMLLKRTHNMHTTCIVLGRHATNDQDHGQCQDEAVVAKYEWGNIVLTYIMSYMLHLCLHNACYLFFLPSHLSNTVQANMLHIHVCTHAFSN